MGLAVLRVLLVGLGLVGVALALVADHDFIEAYVLRREITDFNQAGALPAARATIGAVGALLVLAGALLPRIARLPVIRRLVACPVCIQWVLFCLPVILLLAVATSRITFGITAPLYLLLVREDSVVEYLTACAYVIAGPLALALARHLLRTQEYPAALVRLLYAGLFIFVALEEISYGQRIIGFGTPDYFEVKNVQREVTLHNIDGVAGLFLLLAPLCVGVFGAAGWLLLPVRQHLPGRLAMALSHAVPPWFTASYFLPSAIYALYWLLRAEGDAIIQEDQELTEVLVALGFLIFTTDAFLARHRRREQAAAAGSVEGAGAGAGFP